MFLSEKWDKRLILLLTEEARFEAIGNEVWRNANSSVLETTKVLERDSS